MNNPSAAIPSIQMILSWTLLGVLLAWMFFSAFLAFRPRKAEKCETADLPTPSGAFPAIRSRTPLRRTSSPADMPLSSAPMASTESGSEVGVVPVA